MTLRYSNTTYLTVLAPLPRENIGWWVEVYDANSPNTLLARIARYESLSHLDAVSDTGMGAVAFLADDPVLTDPLPAGLPNERLLSYPTYWRIIDNGVERQRFFFEGRKLKKVDKDDGTKLTVITGRGRAAELEFGTVLPSNWPTQSKAISRKYVARSWAYVWLDLFTEAKARGSVPADMRPTFTATTDSQGQPWTDSGDYDIPVGGDLLTWLNEFKESAGFDWRVMPNGTIIAATALGFNRSQTVRFYEGLNVQVAEDAEDRTGLRNDVYVQAGDGLIAHAVDGPSIARHRRRETFIASGGTGNISAASLTANGALKQLKDPITSRSFTVPLDQRDDDGTSLGRRAYVDYAPGDTIGYGQRLGDGSSDYKVVSFAVEISSEGEELELTVLSKREQLIEKLKRLLAKQLGGGYSPSSAGGSITAVVKQTISANTDLGSLSDVDVAGAVDGAVLRWSAGLGRWIDSAFNLDALSDVDLSVPPTNGQTMVYDSTAGLWKPGTISGGGGGGGAALLPLDKAPTFPHAKDDEFTGSSLDAKWTKGPDTSWSTAAVADGFLSLVVATASKHAYQLRQAAPTGDFTITAKVACPLGSSAQDVRSGLFVARTTGTKSLVWGLALSGGPAKAMWIEHSNYSDTVDWGAYNGSWSGNLLGTYGGGFLWYRLKWVSATGILTMSISTDGVQWVVASTRGSWNQPDRIGLVIENNSGNTAVGEAISVEWFRVTEP